MLIIKKRNYIIPNKSTYEEFFPLHDILLPLDTITNFIYFPQFPQRLLLLCIFIIRKYIKVEDIHSRKKYLIAIIEKMVLICN